MFACSNLISETHSCVVLTCFHQGIEGRARFAKQLEGQFIEGDVLVTW